MFHLLRLLFSSLPEDISPDRALTGTVGMKRGQEREDRIIQRPVFPLKKHSFKILSESQTPKKFITSLLIIHEP